MTPDLFLLLPVTFISVWVIAVVCGLALVHWQD